MQIVDHKGEDNPVADHLSRMERIRYDPVPINESFPGESLAMIRKIEPWFADHANFLVGKYMPPDMSYHQRKKFFNDLKYYFWDDPFLYRHGPDDMIRRYVPEHEMNAILEGCHSSPYAGHHAEDRTATKVLQLGFY